MGRKPDDQPAEPDDFEVEIDDQIEQDEDGADEETDRLVTSIGDADADVPAVSNRLSNLQKRKMLWAAIALVAVVVAVGGVTSSRPSLRSSDVQCALDPTCVLSSPRDERTFVWETLPNGLHVLAVSDPSMALAGAAVDVGAGSLFDPRPADGRVPALGLGQGKGSTPAAEAGKDGYPGLAHFLEHLLFMGTEAYPNENEYGAYLSANGGGSNAFTSLHHTNYFFNVRPEALQGALDRFSGFFIAPLLRDNATSREVLAVDSEHKKNLLSDGWRSYQLLRHMAHEASPWHGFATGNAETLSKPGVRAALLAFHAAHYCAHNMRAVVAGPQDVEVLLRMARDTLHDVPTDCAPWGRAKGNHSMVSVPSEAWWCGTGYESSSVHATGGQDSSTDGGKSGTVHQAQGNPLRTQPSSMQLLAQLPLEERRMAVLGVWNATRLVQTSTAPDQTYPLPSSTVGQAGLPAGQAPELVDDEATSPTADSLYQPPAHVRGSMVVTAPVTDMHDLSLYWPLWPQADNIDNVRLGAASYIAGALGDESEGGLLHRLRAAGLASGLQAGVDTEAGGTALLAVSVQLSPLLIAQVNKAATETAAPAEPLQFSNNDRLYGTAVVVPAARSAARAVLQPAIDRISAAVWAYLDLLEQGLMLEVQEMEGQVGTRAVEGTNVPAPGRQLILGPGGTQQPRWRVPAAAGLPGETPATIFNKAGAQGGPQVETSNTRGIADLAHEPRTTVTGRVWNESHVTASLRFAFPTREAADNMASRLSSDMQVLGPKDILGSPARAVWQPKVVLHTIQALLPGGSVTALTSSIVALCWDLPRVEPIYKTRYAVVQAPVVHAGQGPEWAWREAIPPSGDNPSGRAPHGRGIVLNLPSPNAFLPPETAIREWLEDVHGQGQDGTGHSTTNKNSEDVAQPAGLGLPHMRQVRKGGHPAQSDRGGQQTQGSAADEWARHDVHPILMDLRPSISHSYASVLSNLRTAGVLDLMDGDGGAAAAARPLAQWGLDGPENNSGSASAGQPSVAAEDIVNRTRLWWAPDRYFGQPRVYAGVYLTTAAASASARQHVLTQLLVACASEAGRTLSYTAAKAGATISVGSVSGVRPGLSLTVAGYSPSIQALLEAGLPLLWPASVANGTAASITQQPSLHPSITADLVVEQLLQLGEDLSSTLASEQPYQTARRQLAMATGEVRWSLEQQLAEVHELCAPGAVNRAGLDPTALRRAPSQVTVPSSVLKTFGTHARDLWAGLTSLQAMVYGDASSSQATDMFMTVGRVLHANIAVSRWALWSEGRPIPGTTSGHTDGAEDGLTRLIRPPAGMSVVRAASANPADDNGAAYVTWAVGRKSSGCGPAWQQVQGTGPGAARTSSGCDIRAAAALVLGSMLYEPFFTALRTQQTLGYIVSAGVRSSVTALAGIGPASGDYAGLQGTGLPSAWPSDDSASCAPQPVLAVDGPMSTVSTTAVCPGADPVLSLYAVAQGPAVPAHVMDERVQMFAAGLMGGAQAGGQCVNSSSTGGVSISTVHDSAGHDAVSLPWGDKGSAADTGGMPAVLLAATEDEVSSTAAALRSSRLSPPDGPAAAWARVWSEAMSLSWDWTARDREAQALAKVSKAHVVQLYREAVLGDAATGQARRFSAQVFSARSLGAEGPGTSSTGAAAPTPAWPQSGEQCTPLQAAVQVVLPVTFAGDADAAAWELAR